MGAAQQVFDVNELLEIIIWQVEAHQIPELKLLGKSWFDVIKTSNAVHRARVRLSFRSLDPFKGQDLEAMSTSQLKTAMELEYLEFDTTISAFSSLDCIRINPVLDKVWKGEVRADPGFQHCEVVIRLPPISAALRSSFDQYVTEPPCRSLTLARLRWNAATSAWNVPDVPNFCWAENPTGLRVSDIIKVRDQISAMDTSSVAKSNAETVAIFEIQSTLAEEDTPEDHALSCAYFDGPLPRFRRASHKLGREGVEAYRKDEAMFWEPKMDDCSNVESSRTERLN